MRKLNNSEKEDLKALFNHKGYKLMESLVADYKLDLVSWLLAKDLWNPEIVKALTKKQDELIWVNNFLFTIRNQTNWIWKRKED